MIKRYLPTYNTPIASIALDYRNDAHPLLQAVDSELNFFEFLAIGIYTGDMDDEIAKRSYRSLLRAAVEQYRPYIDHWQALRSSTWEHATRLYQDWA